MKIIMTLQRTLLIAKNIVLLIFCLLLMLFEVANADIARSIRQADTESANANFFELGVGVISLEAPAVLGEDTRRSEATLVLNGRYQWHGLFVEAFAESYGGVYLGYNVLNTEHWSLDIVGTSQFDEISADEYESLAGIKTREGDFAMGIRTAGYYDNFTLQFQLLDDRTDAHKGLTAAAMIGKNWQVRNWNFHSIVGAHYQSGNTLDYYFGIDEDEVSETFPLYQLGSETMFTAEIGVTYPLTEKWVLRSTLIVADVPKSIGNSPIVENSSNGDAAIFMTSVNYVFK